MKKLIIAFYAFFLLVPLVGMSQEKAVKVSYAQSATFWGDEFKVVAVTDNEKLAKKGISKGIKEIKNIEKLISSSDPKSQVNKINKYAGVKPVKVDDDLYSLIATCQKISEMTGGAFDITSASLANLWNFDGAVESLPQQAAIQEALSLINYKNIILDENKKTVYLKNKGMKIGFGEIGKGYAAKMGANEMIDKGIEHGLINVDGDIYAWGLKEDGTDWEIALSSPPSDSLNQPTAWFRANGQAVITVGNYEKVKEVDDKMYHDRLDPKTGYPTRGIKSVTIVASDAVYADALASAVFVLGVDKGIELINKLEDTHALIVTEDGKMKPSDNLEYWSN
ncbi:FAD:protein FMN transferase [Aureibacter tunicatorum]|uniref:FAD:protein FMN transferase n=1 Tax=Aureibacter tunicatorum TaxID=866807 RepID=A0AAE4BT18_9BACT|nr:FAD:protein FMN transferase [Aureibacter tunicatorum]MDR6239398.1 thiamine biosynthesis lipoprotein [Aureibacter tunicatorum]BDD04679.1 FAD:protein FMN transferase [Aureibacter tunicatorum]